MGSKPLLADNYDNLFYPPFHPGRQNQADYKYFDFPGCRFRPNEFCLENALWLADASLLAYESSQVQVEELRKTEFSQVKDFARASTQGFVAQTPSSTIVSFRGTEVDSLRDLLTDLKVQLVSEDSTGQGCLVHKGFLHEIQKVEERVGELLRDAPTPVYFTGHSLGAALATLAAFRYQGPGPCWVYAFGSPRVGNEMFCTQLEMKCPNRLHRFVNSQDVVTLLPTEAMGYEHAGEEHYICASGKILSGRELHSFDKLNDVAYASLVHDAAMYERMFAGGVWTILGRLLQLLFRTKRSPIEPAYFLGNHSPARYPVRIWNALASPSR